MSLFLRSSVLGLAVVSLAFRQPPAESSLGTLPTPAAVAIAGVNPDAAVENLDLWKWSLTQGGLTIVCLVLIAALYKELRGSKEDKKILIDLVTTNTTAHSASAEATNRLSRALEQKGVL